MASSLLKSRASSDVNKCTDSNISKVIRLLSAEQPCTKKTACEILGIAYNTPRLDKIIQDFKDKKAAEKARRAAKRGTELSKDEVSIIVSEYLEGKDLLSISKLISRTVPKVKWAIEFYGVPKRGSQDYFKPELIPDTAVRQEFRVGERVWSARYETVCEILKEVPHKDEKVYRVWLEGENHSEYAYQPASELASLNKFTELGIKL